MDKYRKVGRYKLPTWWGTYIKNMGSLAIKALAAVTVLLITKGGKLLNTASQIAVSYEFPQFHKFGLTEISFNTRFRFVNHSRGKLKVDRLRIRVFSKSSAGVQELGKNSPK